MKTETGEFLLVLTLFGVLFLASVDNQLLIPLLPLLSSDLNVSVESLGRLFSAYALAAALFNLVIGPLTDRFGRVLFLRLGLVAFAAAALSTYFSRGYTELLILRSVTGLAAAVLSTCTASLVGDFFPYHRRGRVMGMVLSAYFLALIIGIPLGAYLAEQWEWHVVFLASFVLSSILLVRTLVFFPDLGLDSRQRPTPLLSSYARFFSNGSTIGGLATSFAISGATLAFLTFIAAYLNDAYSATPMQVSWLFTISGIGAMAGSFVSGWLTDRWGKRAVFLAANTFLALPLLLLEQVAFGIPMIVVFLSISLLVASRQTALQTLQTQLIPGHERGTFLGLRNGVSQLGIALAVLVAGSLYSVHGYGAVTRFAAGLTLSASIVFYVLVKEPD